MGPPDGFHATASHGAEHIALGIFEGVLRGPVDDAVRLDGGDLLGLAGVTEELDLLAEALGTCLPLAKAALRSVLAESRLAVASQAPHSTTALDFFQRCSPQRLQPACLDRRQSPPWGAQWMVPQQLFGLVLVEPIVPRFQCVVSLSVPFDRQLPILAVPS